MSNFQESVGAWVEACFGVESAKNVQTRSWRFLEEALELVQSVGCTKEEAFELVKYVFSRPIGVTEQEVGGVALTLAAFCNSKDISFLDAGEKELARVWTKVEKIRQKESTKPEFSALPGVSE